MQWMASYYFTGHRQFHARTGTLTEAIRIYRKNKPRRMIVFAKSGTENCAENGAFQHQHYPFFPPRFKSVINDDLNGTFGIYRYEDTITGTNETSYDSWSTFKIKHTYQGKDSLFPDYHWSQISVLVRQFQGQQFVLFVNCPPSVSEQIMESVYYGAHGFKNLENPYLWHVSLAEELEDVYDKAVWKVRDLVRGREKERDKPVTKAGTAISVSESDNRKNGISFYTPDFPRLREIARHLIHINETFEVAIDTLESMRYHHAQFFTESQNTRKLSTGSATDNSPAQQPAAEWHKIYSLIQERMYLATKRIKAIKARASTLSERLSNEADLYNHQITMVIADTTRRDNATVKALTLVGVFYLPGTFISGIFGSNFFNYTPGSSTGRDWNMSDKFWVYWVVTIPLTLMTLYGWAKLDDLVRICSDMLDWASQLTPFHRPHLPHFSFPSRGKNPEIEIHESKV
ncbi:hypothetical protein BGW36DRAFT_376609 [Talaromyces proteolyticus]|uniref:Uncharacterized protein n=1 Tax=Talaromyces proteolyticus TaxID=1131652 RepID=A0AAD4KWV5_9EURO|nr:uncharacterized protein BGW36DRAFT_376609 [Talaromyces proteolyticus]KAH8698688.1 hypothetical protein BGW36DRAFT_376609 [Talaromyces proteolyticus]